MNEPYCERDPNVLFPGARPESLCEQDVHAWFELTYASYAVLARVLMQAMPAKWQHDMVNLLGELQQAFPGSPSTYTVLLRDETGKFIADDLRSYRYPNTRAVEAARKAS